MNNKTLYILAGVFVALLGVFFLLQKFGPAPSDDTAVYALPGLRPQPGGSTPPKTEANDIHRVEIDRAKDQGREKLVFERTDRGWKLLNPSARVDAQIVDRLVDQVRKTHKEESADISTNLAELGLEPPKMVITLTRKADGKEFHLNVGNQSAGKAKDAVVYVNSSEVAEPMAVRRGQLDEAFREVKDYLQLELLAVSALNSSFAQFEGPGHKPIFAIEKRAEDRWYFTNPAELGEADTEGAPLPPDPPPQYNPPVTGVKALMEAVGGIQTQSGSTPAAISASDADLAQFGLETDKYVTLRIEVKRTGDSLAGGQGFRQPVTEAVLIGHKVAGGPNQGERYYARRADERVVVIVPGKPVSQILPVLAKPDLLQNRDLANLDRPKSDAIDVKTPEGLAKLRRCGVPEAWRVYGTAEPTEADQKTVRTLLDTIISRRTVTGFPPEKPDAEYGFDKPSAVVSVWAAAIPPDPDKGKQDPPPEPKLTNEPVVVLTFGKTEKDSVFVRRKEGKTTRLLTVPANLLAKIALPPLGFANRTLPSFTLDQAVKLELVRDGKTVSLENQAKEGSPDAEWKIVAPKEEAGAADSRAVGDILGELSRLQPERLVGEKGADLDKFGLKSPALKATVTLRKGERKMSYLFGKETEDKKGIYARQGEREVLFVVDAGVIKPLRADLGDRSVFRFDAGKVKELTLTGWKKLGKGPQTLRLARTDKGWDVKEAPVKDFAVNAALVDDLLGEKLARLGTEKFVVRQSGPKPNHGVDEANRALQITIVLEGAKEPLTLVIGGLDPGEKAYFATASTRSGDVFLLPQKSYEEILKDGPAYFKK